MINKRSMLLKVSKSSRLQRVIDERVQKKFEAAKAQMEVEFLAHPVTQEILAGEDASNISGTLRGRGNLFGFIGFEKGSDPVTQALALIRSSTQMRFLSKGTSGGKAVFKYKIFIPNRDAMEAATPMPWLEGRSWLYDIEKGISGFSQFLAKVKSGRSGAGIQSKNIVASGSFKPVEYYGKIINNFISRLNKI